MADTPKRPVLALVDGNSLMHRAFHAIPPNMNAPDGRPTNAIFGFANMLMKLVDTFAPDGLVMAFDKGTGLSEHAAPGEALIFALDGEGVIGYEGKEHVIRAGENFHFAKGGLHFVKATERFKMALFLTLE